MYWLYSTSGRYSSAEIARMVADRHPNRPEAMRHLCEIERIEARGITYSNEDFDVLSSALRYAENTTIYR